jgi:polyisoprenoid-binding protein YceI
MKRTLHGPAAAALFACLAWSAPADSGPRAINAEKSSMRVHVYKTGFFSAFAHNHEIEAPIESGEVTEAGSPSVDLGVDARKLRVLDPEASADTRAQIQATMQGPQVLDANRYPEIHFRSTTVEPDGTDRWRVRGNLDLHGQTHPIAIEVKLQDGVYRGSVDLKQTEFGITPVTVAGGTVKVKDELNVEFQIELAK